MLIAVEKLGTIEDEHKEKIEKMKQQHSIEINNLYVVNNDLKKEIINL